MAHDNSNCPAPGKPNFDFRKFFPVILFVALCLVFGLLNPRFFTVNNLMILLTQAVTG